MLAMEGRTDLQPVLKGGDYRTSSATLNGGRTLNGNPILATKASRMNQDSKAPIAKTTVAAAAADPAEDDAEHMHRHMWIVTGTAGSGKTTVAEYLAGELQVPYIEGDDVSLPLPARDSEHGPPPSSLTSSVH